MIKGWVLQEDIIVLNIIHVVKQPLKYTKHILVVKEESDKSLATVGDWEISIHPSHMLICQMGRGGETNSKDMKEIETTWDIYKIMVAKENILFTQVHMEYMQKSISCTLNPKEKLNKFIGGSIETTIFKTS